MKRLLFMLLTLSLLSGLVSCVEQERRPYYDDSYGPYDRADRYDIGTRIDNQQRRIDQGISSGELTRKEADLLIDNLNWIRDEYSWATRDSRLTQSEIERLSEHLNQNNRMITDKKNNKIRRVYAPPPSPPAPAPSPAPWHEQSGKDFRDRIEKQQKRIDKGVSKGDLTRQEADMLQDNLNHIRDEYSRMNSDGRLTSGEADRLERDLNVNDRMIQDKRNNQIKRLYRPASGAEETKQDFLDFRMESQMHKIDDRTAKGYLTRREAEIVRQNLDRIKAAYSRMKADGGVSPNDLKMLEKKLDRNDNMIHDKKKNPIERID